jgi:hypothetical protein
MRVIFMEILAGLHAVGQSPDQRPVGVPVVVLRAGAQLVE